VVPAFAIGLFFSFMPFPGHGLMAIMMALALRVNIPVAVLSTLVSNPLTMGPMYFLAYRIGFHILGLEPQPFEFEMSMVWVRESLGTIWQPLVLGCLLLGSVLSLIGYIGLDLLWRASIADYLAKKREKRARNRTQS
jgi:uncharacterized protein (DUF2062 family)